MIGKAAYTMIMKPRRRNMTRSKSIAVTHAPDDEAVVGWRRVHFSGRPGPAR
jgi:hypothetical protein